MQKQSSGYTASDAEGFRYNYQTHGSADAEGFGHGFNPHFSSSFHKIFSEVLFHVLFKSPCRLLLQLAEVSNLHYSESYLILQIFEHEFNQVASDIQV